MTGLVAQGIAEYSRHVRIECGDIKCDPLTLAEDWPWWSFPDTSDIENEIKADPRWAEWVKRTKE